VSDRIRQPESLVLEPSPRWRNLVGAVALLAVFAGVVASIKVNSLWPVLVITPVAVAAQFAVSRLAPRVVVSAQETRRRHLASGLLLALILLLLLFTLFGAHVP